MNDLYRREAREAMARTGSTIVLLSPPAAWWGSALALALLGAAVVFVCCASYAQKVSLGGELLPAHDAVRIVSGMPGVVVERHVGDGQPVKRGQLLFVVQGEHLTPQASSGATSASTQRRRIAHAEAGLAQATARITALRGGIALAADGVRALEPLVADGDVAFDSLRSRRRELFELRANLAAAEQQRLAQRNELAALRAEWQQAVVAPVDGVVAAPLVECGQAVASGEQLAQLVPPQATLKAYLHAPSRAMAEILPGATVHLRYPAFPHQKFGVFAGKVVEVSSTSLRPQFVAGQGRYLGPLLDGVGAREPLYRIVVELPAQSVTLDGRTHALRHGMTVDADVLLRRRRIVHWMLDPLYSAARRLH